MNVVMIAKCRLVHSLVTAASGRVYVYMKKKKQVLSRWIEGQGGPKMKKSHD